MDAKTKAFVERQRILGEAQELPLDIEPYGEARVQRLAAINAQRAALGFPPLENDEVGHPELTEKRRRASERYNRSLTTTHAHRPSLRGNANPKLALALKIALCSAAIIGTMVLTNAGLLSEQILGLAILVFSGLISLAIVAFVLGNKSAPQRRQLR